MLRRIAQWNGGTLQGRGRAVRRYLLGAVVFGACGLIGPALHYAVWPFVNVAATKGSPDDVISSLILLLWPTVLAATAPTAEERAGAEFLAVGWNVVVFAALGLIVALVARQPRAFWGSYCALSVIMCVRFAAYAGFELQYMNVPALVLGLVIHSVPFLLLRAALVRDRMTPGRQA
jgi:hypothetical protein